MPERLMSPAKRPTPTGRRCSRCQRLRATEALMLAVIPPREEVEVTLTVWAEG